MVQEQNLSPSRSSLRSPHELCINGMRSSYIKFYQISFELFYEFLYCLPISLSEQFLPIVMFWQCQTKLTRTCRSYPYKTNFASDIP